MPEFVDSREILARIRAKRAKQNGTGQRSGKQLIVHRASDITPVAVDWLWPGRLAIGKTTLVGGDPALRREGI